MRGRVVTMLSIVLVVLATGSLPAHASGPLNTMCLMQYPPTGDPSLDTPTCTHDWLGTDFSANTGDFTVVGVDFEHPDYQGSALVWVTEVPGGCTAGVDFYTNYMPPGWEDVVSSAQGYSGCNTYLHYEHPNLQGASLSCTCAAMGVMDDATSSEYWTR